MANKNPAKRAHAPSKASPAKATAKRKANAAHRKNDELLGLPTMTEAAPAPAYSLFEMDFKPRRS